MRHWSPRRLSAMAAAAAGTAEAEQLVEHDRAGAHRYEAVGEIEDRKRPGPVWNST